MPSSPRRNRSTSDPELGNQITVSFTFCYLSSYHTNERLDRKSESESDRVESKSLDLANWFDKSYNRAKRYGMSFFIVV